VYQLFVVQLDSGSDIELASTQEAQHSEVVNLQRSQRDSELGYGLDNSKQSDM
jgi:hypothetical protein